MQQRRLELYGQPYRLAEALAEAGVRHNEVIAGDINGIEVKPGPPQQQSERRLETFVCNTSVVKKSTIEAGDNKPLADPDGVSVIFEDSPPVPQKPGWYNLVDVKIRYDGAVFVYGGRYVEMQI